MTATPTPLDRAAETTPAERVRDALLEPLATGIYARSDGGAGAWTAATIQAEEMIRDALAPLLAEAEAQVERWREDYWTEYRKRKVVAGERSRAEAALSEVAALHPREVIAVHEVGPEAWCPTCQQHWPCETGAILTRAALTTQTGGTDE